MTLVLEDAVGTIDWVDCRVRLDDLDYPAGPVANRMLRESVRSIGVLSPVLLASRNGSFPPFQIIDGCRRVIAAKEVGLVDIPARVARLDETNAAILTLICNQQRSPNPVAEVAAVEHLGHERIAETEVAHLTGMPVQTIRKRKRMRNLIDEFFDLFAAGDLGVALAEELAKLPEGEQRQVLHRFTVDGEKLTHWLLQDVRAVRREAAITAILPALDASDEPHDIRTSDPNSDSTGATAAGGGDPLIDLIEAVRHEIMQATDLQVVRKTDRLLGELEGRILRDRKAAA